MLRISPVNTFKHIAKLRAQYRDRSRHHRGPYETATLQPFGIKRHAKPIMPEDLDQIAAAATKDKEVSLMRIAALCLLYLGREAVHAASHIRMNRDVAPST